MRDGQEGLHVARGATPPTWPARIGALADDAGAARARMGRSARARGWSSATRGRATASSSRACCGGSRVKIVLASEVYPPRAGGAGWSTRALALGLREAGHDVSVITTSPGPEDLDGLAVQRLAVRGRKRLRVPARVRGRASRGATDAVVHAQHSLSALGALAGRDAGPRGRHRARPLAGLLLVDAHQPRRALPRLRPPCP